MENKRKKSTGLIVTIVILSLVIFFLILFICLDKFVFSSTSSKKEEKKQEETITEKEPEKIEPVEAKEISITEISEMKSLAELVFQEKSKLEYKDITNQAKLNIAISLTGKSLDEIKGKELIDIIHKYFGQNAELKLEGIDCFLNHENEKENKLYLYDEKTDSFYYNNDHPGHGGLGNSGRMLFFDSIKYVDNEYQFVIGVLYTDTACGDICEGKYYKDNGKVYKTADDLNNRKNPLIDAALDNSLYTYGDYSEEFGNEYIYNFDKIYEKVRNKVNKYEFTFTKENGSFVFKNMKAI